MKQRLQILIAALVFSLNCLYPQDHIPGHIINLLEEMAALSDEGTAAGDYLDEITNLLENPVPVNCGDENELKRLFFLTPFQVKSLIDYTGKYGPVISNFEISFIPGFDKELAELLGPFISLEQTNSPISSGRRQFKIISNYLTRTKDPESEYLGRNYKSLSKLKFQNGRVEANLITEKDRGEKFFAEKYQPDFFSGNISCKPDGIIDKIILGDYKVRFGQGLTAWNGFSRTPLPTANILMKSSSTIMPYTSSGENDYFRGLALELSTGRFNIITFASLNAIDATINTNEENGSEYISSFYSSGLHNTTTTFLKRNTVKENSLGFNVNRLFKKYYCGISGIYTNFSLPVIPGESMRNYYDFRGRTNASLALDYAYLFKESYLFGELSVNETGKTAYLQGLSLNQDGVVKLNLVYSRINRGYNSFHGSSSLSETFNKPSRNILANISAELFAGIKVSAGLLHKKELWYNNISANFPLSLKYHLRIDYEPLDFISVSSDIRIRKGYENISPEQGMKTDKETKKTNLRLSFKTIISDHLSLRTRIEKVILRGAEDSGVLCYHSAAWDFRKIPVSIRLRFTVFNTGSYDSRIYAWEDDLLYNPTVKALYDKGSRTYFMIIYKPINNITLRVKYAISDIPALQEESGLLNELKLQAVMKF